MTKEQLTKKIMEELHKKFYNNSEVKNIIDNNLTINDIENNTVFFVVNHKYYITILDQFNVIEFINEKVNEFLQKQVECDFTVKNKEKMEKGFNMTSDVDFRFKKVVEDETINNWNNSSVFNLQDKFTFDNYIKANYNKQCYDAAVVVTKNLGDLWNPLFIYGHSGLGKTHLLNAIGNKIAEIRKDLKVILYNAENFCSDYIDLQFHGSQRVEEFKKEIASHDVLLIDDIQFNANKDKTNEIFFHLFEKFYNQRKQIVITSDTHPKKLNGFHKRLISRFDCGLTMSIKDLDKESAKVILNAKIKKFFEKKHIDDQAIEYIVKHFNDSVRELEGVLARLKYYDSYISGSDNSGDQIDLQLVKLAFAEIVSNYDNETISADNIIRVVASYYQLNVEEIKSNSKKPVIVQAKRLVMYLIKEFLNFTNIKIARYLNMKTHGTIVKGYNKIKTDLQSNPELEKAVTNIKGIIQDQS